MHALERSQGLAPITVILLTAESNAKTVTSLFTLLSVLAKRSGLIMVKARGYVKIKVFYGLLKLLGQSNRSAENSRDG